VGRHTLPLLLMFISKSMWAEQTTGQILEIIDVRLYDTYHCPRSEEEK